MGNGTNGVLSGGKEVCLTELGPGVDIMRGGVKAGLAGEPGGAGG
jgi:hypothetical protein